MVIYIKMCIAYAEFFFILHRDLFFKRRKTNRYTGPTGRYTGITGRFTGSSCPSHITGIPAKPAGKPV